MEYGDFSFIKDEMFRKSVENAFKYVNDNKLWEFFKTFEVDSSKGFMFSRHPVLERISKALDSDGHSGASFAVTMRNMELIAKNDWETYVNIYNKLG